MSDCYICGNPNSQHAAGSGSSVLVKCDVCGTYDITTTLIAFIGEADQRLRMGLAAHTKQANKQGDTLTLKSDNYEAFARQHLHTSIGQKLHRLLEMIAEASGHPGVKVKLDMSSMFPMIDAASALEMGFYLYELQKRGDIEQLQDHSRLTTQGWQRLEPVGGAGTPGTCFVAMSFDTSLTPAYDGGIRPAVVEDCGFEIIRVDRVEHVENINDKIIADLRRCQFVVADFTKHPNGVYFEAGYALGLGRLVFWTCRKDDFSEHVHFDTRPYNHILWTDPAELRERLTNRIRALLQTPKD